jgi:hypothetical protein
MGAIVRLARLLGAIWLTIIARGSTFSNIIMTAGGGRASSLSVCRPVLRSDLRKEAERLLLWRTDLSDSLRTATTGHESLDAAL